MSEQVSSFIPVQLGDLRYLFLVVTWNDFATPIADELQKQKDAFGEAMGLYGTVASAFRSAKNATYLEVRKKAWPPDTAYRMEREQDPFMVVIDRSFADFDPQAHPWSVIWFSDFFENAGSIYRVFAALAQKVRNNEDVFGYLSRLSRQEKYKKWTQHLEIKPGLWGISINVKAILDDLVGA
jgi:hypothetical protein